MEVRIGVRDVAREIAFETNETPAAIGAAVAVALRDGSVLDLADDKGRRYFIPAAVIGFVHVGEAEGQGRLRRALTSGLSNPRPERPCHQVTSRSRAAIPGMRLTS